VPRTYDPEFHRRVLELMGVGRPERVSPPELGLAEAMGVSVTALDFIDRRL
jgi:hypothetical protein